MAGTARPSPPSGPAAHSDANPTERAAAVDLLGRRVGALHPPGAAPAGPPPPPGAFGARTRVAAEAVTTYDAAVAAGRGREAGLFYNPNTGEFAVQLGTESQVRAPAGDGWQALIHLHPNPENVLTYRLPAPADIWGAMRSAMRTGTHVEFVQSTRPDGTMGVTRVEVSVNPVRILVEMPAEGNEPARRIEVASADAYAREYGADTTHLDPTSPQYAWVMRDLDEYYRLKRQDGPPGADDGRTAMGTAPPAPAAPTLRDQLTTGRADVTKQFADADAQHAQSGAPGPPPSAQFDAVIAHLTNLGMGAAGRTAIEDLFAPARGRSELSETRFKDGLAQIQRITAMLGAQPDLATSGGLAAHMSNDVLYLADEVVSRWDGGTLAGGLGLGPAAQGPARTAIEAVRVARDRYRANQTGDPVERLMSLLRVRDAVSDSMQVLQQGQGAIVHGATTLGTAAASTIAGVTEQPITVTAEGRVQQSLDRHLPGGDLERNLLTPEQIRRLQTNPPGLAAQLATDLHDYHRAHLVGPGFGSELLEGLMLAPEAGQPRAAEQPHRACDPHRGRRCEHGRRGQGAGRRAPAADPAGRRHDQDDRHPRARRVRDQDRAGGRRCRADQRRGRHHPAAGPGHDDGRRRSAQGGRRGGLGALSRYRGNR